MPTLQITFIKQRRWRAVAACVSGKIHVAAVATIFLLGFFSRIFTRDVAIVPQEFQGTNVGST